MSDLMRYPYQARGTAYYKCDALARRVAELEAALKNVLRAWRGWRDSDAIEAAVKDAESALATSGGTGAAPSREQAGRADSSGGASERPNLIFGYYSIADATLALAQSLVEQLRAENDDSRYGLLESAHSHIIHARGDLDADLK